MRTSRRVAVISPIKLLAAHAALIVALPTGNLFAAPLLPDLIAWETNTPPYYYMHDGSMDQATIANKVLYRFSQPIVNIGAGALELREVTHPTSSRTSTNGSTIPWVALTRRS